VPSAKKSPRLTRGSSFTWPWPIFELLYPSSKLTYLARHYRLFARGRRELRCEFFKAGEKRLTSFVCPFFGCSQLQKADLASEHA